MRNKIFQWLWYKIVRPCVKCDDTKTGFFRSAKRYKSAYRLSKLFGGWDAVLMGDSNEAVDDTYENMKKYKSLVMCIGAGGTTAGDIIAFLCSPSGSWLFDAMKKTEVFFNTGGNYCLQNKMDIAKLELKELHQMFPASWNQTTPPVRAWLLDMLDNTMESNKSEVQWQQAFSILNDYISEIWQPFIIDMHRILKDPKTSDAYLLALKDAVHYSDYSVSLRQNILNALI
jgi:hypothetical protein